VTSSDGKGFINQGISYGAPWLGSFSDVKTIPSGVTENVSIVEYGNPLWNLPRFMTLLDSQCFNFMASEHWLQRHREFFSLGCHKRWFLGSDNPTGTYSIKVTLIATSVANPSMSITVTRHYEVKYDQVSKSPLLVEETT